MDGSGAGGAGGAGGGAGGGGSGGLSRVNSPEKSSSQSCLSSQSPLLLLSKKDRSIKREKIFGDFNLILKIQHLSEICEKYVIKF